MSCHTLMPCSDKTTIHLLPTSLSAGGMPPIVRARAQVNAKSVSEKFAKGAMQRSGLQADGKTTGKRSAGERCFTLRRCSERLQGSSLIRRWSTCGFSFFSIIDGIIPHKRTCSQVRTMSGLVGRDGVHRIS